MDFIKSLYTVYPIISWGLTIVSFFLLLVFGVYKPIHKAEIKKGKNPKDGGLAMLVTIGLAGSAILFIAIYTINQLISG